MTPRMVTVVTRRRLGPTTKAALGVALLALTLPGCLTPSPESPDTTPSPTPTISPAQVNEPCFSFDVDATPATGPAGSARTLVASFTNCGDTATRLAHACARGMDLRILVLYNTTTPDEPAPPGVGPKGSYIVDNPVAGLPLLCATAPPHVRTIPPGQTMTYGVAWSGLYAPPGCEAATCARILGPGRYLVSANAIDADTEQAYIATTVLTLTGAGS